MDQQRRPRIILGAFLGIVGANFLAQVPYYYHQYYARSHRPPTLLGAVLMLLVLAWFVVGYWRIAARKPLGLVLSVSFLLVEFLFYLQTQIVQAATGNGILLHVLHPDDPLLFVVFLIGYINLLATPFLVWGLLRYRESFLPVADPAS